MAIFLASPGSATPIGKLGGVVFCLAESRGDISNVPRRPNSTAGFSSAQLQMNATARAAWADLSSAELASWQAMSIAYQTGFGFSELSNLSAHNLFMRTYVNLLASASPIVASFATLQVQGRRQAVPDIVPQTLSDSVEITWRRAKEGTWANQFSWMKLRRSVVEPLSRSRPGRTFRTLQNMSTQFVFRTGLFTPVTIPDVGFERDEGWQRWEYQAFDAFGWFANARSQVLRIMPQKSVWFYAYGSYHNFGGQSWIEYVPPTLRVKNNNVPGSPILSTLIGAGGLLLVRDVVSWLRFPGFMEIAPSSLETSNFDASGLRPIARKSVNPRFSPVNFLFD